MQFYEDEVSFGVPFRSAFFAVEAELRAAGSRTAGAYARADAALRAKADLHAFKDRLAGHIAAGDFAGLRRLRSWLMPIEACHHLTVGEWRGVFLVGPAAGVTVAILFSRAPHDLRDRLHEAIGRNRPHLGTADPQGPAP